MKNILKKLSGGADIFLGLIGFVGILVITANAFCRFVLKVPMSWSDEFLRTIIVYGYFIGAALMFCTGGAMRLEIMDNALKGHPVGHRILNILLAIVNTGFFGLMTVYVIQMIVQYMVTGTTQSTSTVPAWVIPLGCAIGMLIITAFAVYSLVVNLIRKDRELRADS